MDQSPWSIDNGQWVIDASAHDGFPMSLDLATIVYRPSTIVHLERPVEADARQERQLVDTLARQTIDVENVFAAVDVGDAGGELEGLVCADFEFAAGAEVEPVV